MPGLFTLLATTVSLLWFCTYELGFAAARAFAPGRGGTTWLFVSCALGAAAVTQRARAPAAALTEALAALSLVLSVSGYVWQISASNGAFWLWLALSGSALGAAAGLLLRLGRSLREDYELVAYAMAPGPLIAAFVLAIVVLFAYSALGILRRDGLFGLLLAGLSGVLPDFVRELGRMDLSLRARWLRWLSAPVALAALAGAELRVPLADVRQHTGEVLCSLDTARGHHVLSRLQGGLVLFSDHQIAANTSDRIHFSESLVHPALSAAQSPQRVLVLDDGVFGVLREVVRWPDPREILLIPNDPELTAATRGADCLAQLADGGLSDARIRIEGREPARYVLESHARFDVVIANLPDPSSYYAGKYYTLGFLTALRERLAPNGVLALQLTSPLRTPSTHQGILSTLRAAGFLVVPYRAPLPILGEWGFALARDAAGADAAQFEARVRNVRLPHGAQFLSAQHRDMLFSFAEDNAAPHAPSTLYDQWLVERYQTEEAARQEVHGSALGAAKP